MSRVSHYGLHFAGGGVGFLLQKGSAQSVYDGLTSPFINTWQSSLRSCPHAVDLAQADPGGHHIFEDPLAGWFANPKGVALLMDEDRGHIDLAAKLADLYSPTRPSVEFAWSLQRRFWLAECQVTNLSPWVICEVSSKQVNLVRAFASDVAPRPVLLLAKENLPMPPGGRRLTTDLKPSDLERINLQRLGAWATTKRLLNANS